jgi:hypothetical protein
MSFPKNNTQNGSTTTVVAPKANGTAAQVIDAPIVHEELSPAAIMVSNPTQKTATLQEVFERNDAISRKRENYVEFCKRLDEFIAFRDTHDGSALKSTIENEQGKSVIIANLQLNLDYLNNVIQRGKEAKEQMEFDILNSRS